MKIIEVKNVLKLDCVFVDTRSSKEYEEATIPGSINIPLLSNEERAIVGIVYIKIGKEEAIEKGMEFVSRHLPEMLKSYNKYKNKKIVIFCWRGGMRSRSITALLDSLGFDVYQLIGGHKAFRKYVLERLSNYELKFKLVVLKGLTGSGKTEILSRFKNSIDLEDLAGHRNSILGGVGMKPRSQKMFDALLLKRLEELKNEKCVLIEGESKRLGNIFIPDFLFNAMKKGIKVKLDPPINERVERLVKEYGGHKEEILNNLDRFNKFISKEKIMAMKDLLESNKLEKAALFLLNEYYDEKYKYDINKFKYDLVIRENYFNNLKKFIIGLS